MITEADIYPCPTRRTHSRKLCQNLNTDHRAATEF